MRALVLVVGVVALGVGIFSVSAAATPTTAKAYIGSGLVEGVAHLTSDAEKVIANPKFIPELWHGGGGGFPPTSSVNAWTDFFESGGAVPNLGLVLGAGAAGVGIGSVICNEVLELEGCWFYGSPSADPVEIGEATWHWHAASETFTFPNGAKTTVTIPAFSYTFYSGGGLGSGLWNQTSETCANPVVAGFDALLEDPGTVECTSGKHEKRHPRLPIRYQTTNRTLEGLTKAEAVGKTKYTGKGYCPTAGPGSLSCTTSPPANWSERLKTCLNSPSACGISNSQRDEIGEHIAANTPTGVKEGIHDPFHAYSTVPDCSGLSWESCSAKVTELELVPERHKLTWETAVITDPPNRVEEITPSKGTEVKTGSKVVVTTNPAEAEMPAILPDPEPHETYAHYAARLNPAFSPTRTTVTEANEDVEAGPDAVLDVSPEPDGTRYDPTVKTDVDVKTNPHDAPAAAEIPTCDTSVGEVDWTPLNQPLGSKFPFGVFGFFVGWIGEWEAGGAEAPEWSIPIVPSGVFGSKGLDVTINLDSMAGAVSICRIVFLFASFVGLLWFLGTAAAKLQGDGS
jgi:hypothetical protein